MFDDINFLWDRMSYLYSFWVLVSPLKGVQLLFISWDRRAVSDFYYYSIALVAFLSPFSLYLYNLSLHLSPIPLKRMQQTDVFLPDLLHLLAQHTQRHGGLARHTKDMMVDKPYVICYFALYSCFCGLI